MFLFLKRKPKKDKPKTNKIRHLRREMEQLQGDDATLSGTS